MAERPWMSVAEKAAELGVSESHVRRHAPVTTTLEVYTHTTSAMHRDAMAAYGRAVGE